MNSFRFILFTFACLGWLSGIVLHTSGLMGVMLVDSMRVLIFGTFLSWFPFIIYVFANRHKRERIPLQKMFRHVPKWIRALAFIGIVYAFTSSFGFARNQNNESQEVTRATILVYSGFWIMLYGVAAISMYPRRVNENAPER